MGAAPLAAGVTVMAGNAVYMASQELKLKVLRIAFGYLELGPGAIEFRDGHVFHKDSRTEGPLLDLGQVWKLASPSSKHYQGEMGLEVTSYFRSKGTTYAYGTHAAHVAVDPETGKLEILKYVVVEDIGHPINPRLVHGQVVGGAAQGIGATILEELVYGEDGQPLATTYMDCQGIILRC